MPPAKHSLTLNAHRTSVSLEPEFWQAFRDIAQETGQPLNALAAQIDAQRPPDQGLASAIRVFVLQHFQAAKNLSAGK
jgi:predicted DNA-binding ribbon-helix-helix protein